jgi:hypothetical protein
MVERLALIYQQVWSHPLRVKYVMGDADYAQYNGVMHTLGTYNTIQYLMCFYHVIAKVDERTRGMDKKTRYEVYNRVYDIHVSSSPNEAAIKVETALQQWRSNPATTVFAAYFAKQWLDGTFSKW